jgi:hypothetical protein
VSTEATPAPEAPKAPPAPVKFVEQVSESADDPGVDLNAIIAKFQPDIAAAKAAAQDAQLSGIIAGAPTTRVEPPPGAPAAAPPAGQPAPPKAPEAEPPVLRARQLAALARMEAENRALKEQLEARLAELDQKPKAPVAASVEELQQLALTDPAALARALNIEDAPGFAAQLLYGALGDDAPPELKKELADKQRDAKLAALEARLRQRDQEADKTLQKAQQAARADATDRELFAFAKAVPEELPFLAEESRTNSEAVYEGMCHIAASFIGAGKYPSARECAQLFEDQLRSDYERLSRAVKSPAAPAAASTSAPSQSPASPLGTLNDADTRGRPLAGQPADADDPRAFLERARSVAQSAGYRW